MEIKEVKANVYKATCPICGKTFYATSEEKVLDRLDAHLTADHHEGEEGSKGAEEKAEQ